MRRRFTVFVLGVTVMLGAQTRYGAQTTYGPTVSIEGDHFTVNGVPKFLVFVSYFDGLRASTVNRDNDLAWLSTSHVSGVRIFSNWHKLCPSTAVDDGVIGPNGVINQPRLTNLKNFLIKASENGLVVDVSFDHGIGTSPITIDQYKAAVASVANELTNFKNVFFDIENEYQLHTFSDSDVRAVFQAVRATTGGPSRKLTASRVGDATEAGAAGRLDAMDLVAFHDPRDAGIWFTDARISQHMSNIRSGLSPLVQPIYFQEPQSFDPGCEGKEYDADLSHANTALTAARARGSAAWTFHTRAGFKLTASSIQALLTPSERTTIEGLRGIADNGCWGADAVSIAPQSGSVPSLGGTGGSFSIALNNSCQQSWSVSSNASWLSAIPSSGNGAGTAQYSASEANPSASARIGLLTIRGRTFTVTQPGNTQPGNILKADFNGDGDTDLLWQHSGTGATAVWMMNNGGPIPTELSGDGFTPPVPAPWKIVGSGNANPPDPHTDLFLQNDSGPTTSVSIWHMSGLMRTSGDPIVGPSIPSTWKVRAVGDFNGDGYLDLVWQNASSGDLAVWYLHDFTYVDGVSLSPSMVSDTNWQIVGAADVNGDGKTDLLWHHRTHGDLSVWYMNGVTQIFGESLSPALVADTNWQVVGVGDFNRDGKPDLIWQHTDGRISTWRMNGKNQISGVEFSPSTPGDPPDPLWRIVGPR